jgi:hypothetical protein
MPGTSRFRAGPLALLAVACVAALVVVYIFAPGGPGNCGSCGGSRSAAISSVLGLGAPAHGGTSSHHWWNFTVLWANHSVSLDHLDVAIEDVSGSPVLPGVDWNVSVLQPPTSTLVDRYILIGDTPGWANGGSSSVVTGTVFSLYTGKDNVSGDRFALVGNTADPTGTLTSTIG